MRSIARQSARLASNSRARQSSRARRLPQQQHVRSISHSSVLQTDPRVPPGLPDHFVSSGPRQQEEFDKDEEQRVAGEDHGPATEKSKELRKAGIRTYKQRRKESAQKHEAPKAPPIPDWFLRHNVKLQTETLAPNRNAKNAQVLRCVDKETGHTLFTLPWYEAWPVPGLPGRPDEESKTVTEPNKKQLEQTFFDNKFTLSSTPRLPPAGENESKIRSNPSESGYGDINPHTLLRWSLLEAETGISAGFAMATKGPQSHLRAASKVDISLHCPDSEAHGEMDDIVEDLANLTRSDIIRLDANDFEDLNVESDSDAPGTFSRLAYDVFDGATAMQSARQAEEAEDEEMEEDEDGEDEEDESRGVEQSNHLDNLRKALFKHRHDLGRALGQVKISGAPFIVATSGKVSNLGSHEPLHSMFSSNAAASSWDESRLNIMVDSLLDAPKEKRERDPLQSSTFRSRLLQASDERFGAQTASPLDASHQALWRVWRSSPGCWLPDIAGALAREVNRAGEDASSAPLKLAVVEADSVDAATSSSSHRTIVHLRDLKDVGRSELGRAAIRALVRNVRKRRKAGQEILVVGTTAQDANSNMFMSMSRDDSEDELRSISIPPYFNMSKEEQSRLEPQDFVVDVTKDGSYGRILEINLRHLNSMLQRFRPGDATDLFSEASQSQLKLAGSTPLSQKVLSFDLVQRIVLTAIGLAENHALAETVNASHIALAIHTTVMADQALLVWTNRKPFSPSSPESSAQPKSPPLDQETKSGTEKFQARLDKLKKTCNSHESRLLPGVVDPQNIKAGFKEVHAPPETIDALKTMTSLSLLRPDAFKYGVLAADRLPGLMLYGPPGTGKTLLAKAVAKESRSTVLEISGAQIYEKYVGEGEKMVRAVFSLAKKLSPCIVFIDEGDAIFGSRSSAGNRNTHREIINQFLREWDGMDMHNIFIMVASNRPFDMDDAVLRRLPRRLLVDLPVAKDRESILKIHLKDETLDNSVNLAELSEQTPLYSGSDLKNLCVAAALACVREENELAERKQEEKDFQLPDKRTLSARHFEKAIKEISASISEDMGSLTAIKKFDEQFGDRKGRRKKAAYGFGIGDAGVDESAARVRDTQSPPPP